MTNEKIIYDAAIAAKLYTEDEAAAILMKAGTLPLHTFPEWKRLGYSVKKGEKAAVAVYLWKYTTKPSKAMIEKAAKAGKDVDPQEADPHYYMKLSYLFTDKQVKPTGTPDEEPTGQAAPEAAPAEAPAEQVAEQPAEPVQLEITEAGTVADAIAQDTAPKAATYFVAMLENGVTVARPVKGYTFIRSGLEFGVSRQYWKDGQRHTGSYWKITVTKYGTAITNFGNATMKDAVAHLDSLDNGLLDRVLKAAASNNPLLDAAAEIVAKAQAGQQ